jgi:protein ImuA
MLQTRHAPVAEEVSLAPGVGLVRARAHEAAGPARVTFALLAAARLEGAVLWLQPSWSCERLMGDGVRRFVDPCRLVFGRARTPDELLWAAEEALRTGVVPLVVVELPEAPRLTPVRRLHLAAEAGAERGTAPVALLLTPGAGGTPGIETRWLLAPAPGWARDGRARWRLTRARARMAPERTWEMRIEAGRICLEG